MARIYRALAALLSYPTVDLQAAAGEIGEVLQDAEAGVPPRVMAGEGRPSTACRAFLHDLATFDIYDLQERYLALFDRGRGTSLHLFEHVHGETRDRGQAMADLIALYRSHGFEPTASELPDYLPLFLEFLSLLPDAEAHVLLREPAAILRVLAERIAQRDAGYAAVVRVIATLAAQDVDGRAKPGHDTETSKPGHDASDWPKTGDDTEPPKPGHNVRGVEDPDDLAALDADWEEAAVQFGPGEQLDSCSTDRLRTRLRAAARDVTTAGAAA